MKSVAELSLLTSPEGSMNTNLKSFSAEIFKIGINPYVFVPEKALKTIFKDAGKDKGHIPVVMLINEERFIQHLVKFHGEWRLYLNTPMRVAARKDVGDTIRISIAYDPTTREAPVNTRFTTALNKNKKAKEIFLSLAPSRQKEIVRYINSLKTEKSVIHNIKKAIDFLLGRERFAGRDNP
jgi:hypothetical protein